MDEVMWIMRCWTVSNVFQLFDLGPDGGDNEGDGELIGETDEVAFECGARYILWFFENVF